MTSWPSSSAPRTRPPTTPLPCSPHSSRHLSEAERRGDGQPGPGQPCWTPGDAWARSPLFLLDPHPCLPEGTRPPLIPRAKPSPTAHLSPGFGFAHVQAASPRPRKTQAGPRGGHGWLSGQNPSWCLLGPQTHSSFHFLGVAPRCRGGGVEMESRACHLGTVIPTCMTHDPGNPPPTFSSPHCRPLHNIPRDMLLSSLQDAWGLSLALQLSSIRAGGAGSGNQAHSFISLLGLCPGKPVAAANPRRGVNRCPRTEKTHAEGRDPRAKRPQSS